jgi:leucyl aminopeptidase
LKIQFREEELEKVQTPIVAVYNFEEGPSASGTAEALPPLVKSSLDELKASGEMTGKAYECTLLHHPAGMAAQRLLVVGAGKKDKFNSAMVRRVAGTAVRYSRARGLHDVTWVAGDRRLEADGVQSAVEGAILADYDADTYRSDRNKERRIDNFNLVAANTRAGKAELAAVETGRIIAESQNFTRGLVNEPANLMTPSVLAAKAVELASEFGLEQDVMGPEEIQALKMGAFWAVAQGSAEPAKLIVLRYFPFNAPPVPVVALVGKGITFDTGGISIKPAENMHEMKTDMAGGATMLGVMRAIAQLKPRVRVMAVIPATENMPGGKAYKPGDVITSMSGKTIEILNTDAEGRLVLADALNYAKLQGASVLIDAATLTGAVMIALGNITTGVFGWNKEWVGKVLASGQAAGERMWELPVDDEYRELYKSSIADLANTGGRYGGAITAAMFVGEFAGDTPWVHLDIAGTRWANDEKPYLAKGPTGHPVRTLVHLLTHLQK